MFLKKRKDVSAWQEPTQMNSLPDDKEKIKNSLAVFTGIEKPQYDNNEKLEDDKNKIVMNHIKSVSLSIINDQCIETLNGEISINKEKVILRKIYLKELLLDNQKLLFECTLSKTRFNFNIKVFGDVDKQKNTLKLNIISLYEENISEIYTIRLNYIDTKIDDIYLISSLIEQLEHKFDREVITLIFSEIGLMENMILKI